ncbi:MAG: hypothetical protein AAF726_19560 [Planctomycetota bacterium]
MKLSSASLLVVGVGSLTGVAQSQVLTEVRISTSSIDHEYVEILGTPGDSTDGLMILNVEGDPLGSGGGPGTLDRVYDLSGNFFADEYFVFGSLEASTNFPGQIDLAPGDDLFENSSVTFYLVSVPDPNLRADIDNVWRTTDITDPMGSLTTRIATDPGITILDVVAIWDGDAGDLFYDSAPVFGPDGPFLPSGILRDGGCPGDWCTDTFVTFQIDGQPDPPYADPTPGAINPTTSCATTPSVGDCGSGTLGVNYCNANVNSTGVIGVISATGSDVVADNDVTLSAANLPVTSFGFFLASLDTGFVANPGGSAGNLCLGGSIGRYVGPGEIQNTGQTGGFSLGINLDIVPQPTGPVSVSAGETWRFTAWHRDTMGGMATSNFTNGLEIAFL